MQRESGMAARAENISISVVWQQTWHGVSVNIAWRQQRMPPILSRYKHRGIKHGEKRQHVYGVCDGSNMAAAL